MEPISMPFAKQRGDAVDVTESLFDMSDADEARDNELAELMADGGELPDLADTIADAAEEMRQAFDSAQQGITMLYELALAGAADADALGRARDLFTEAATWLA